MGERVVERNSVLAMFFFFSSRRRHTRYWRDWSSDVCSSDLAYRGAGRPEATYAIERAMDTLGRRLGKDPVELRRMNFIPPFDEPRATAGGLEYDSGNYGPTLDKALELADYEGLRREQGERRERGDGKVLGVGLATYIEMCGL